MNAPPELVEWLAEKVQGQAWVGVREPRAVAHRWVRHTGGRVIRAGLSVSIAPSLEFALHVQAHNIEPEYIAAAKNGVFTVLLSQSWSPVLCCSVSLSAFQVHESESCYAAFYAVAKEATEQLLGVAKDAKHNIAWENHAA